MASGSANTSSRLRAKVNRRLLWNLLDLFFAWRKTRWTDRWIDKLHFPHSGRFVRWPIELVHVVLRIEMSLTLIFHRWRQHPLRIPASALWNFRRFHPRRLATLNALLVAIITTSITLDTYIAISSRCEYPLRQHAKPVMWPVFGETARIPRDEPTQLWIQQSLFLMLNWLFCSYFFATGNWPQQRHVFYVLDIDCTGLLVKWGSHAVRAGTRSTASHPKSPQDFDLASLVRD